jgi:hypothetical protein
MRRCPKCESSRIRRGYGTGSFVLRLIGFRELLCNNCNLRFTRFVVPGTMPKSSHKQKSANKSVETSPVESQQAAVVVETSPPEDHGRHRHEQGNSKRCPQCHSANIHRSSRRGMREKIISVVSFYPYRCHKCEKRFYARRAA